mgnify:FL=1
MITAKTFFLTSVFLYAFLYVPVQLEKAHIPVANQTFLNARKVEQAKFDELVKSINSKYVISVR